MKINNLGLLHCYSTVLLQEVYRYNKLLAEINTSLHQLHDAILGRINMSAVLDAMHTDLLNNRVPANWREVSYPSLKPLASWIADLEARVTFMRTWATTGHPACFWLAGFFFPHGFITGVLQTYARKHASPIDLLSFQFEVREGVDATTLRRGPADGCYVYGLFIENARWSVEGACLEEPLPGEMFSQMPVIHFIPSERGGAHDANAYGGDEDAWVYKCPVYKTSARAGVLSTTGQSTNFILTVDLPCGVRETQEDKIRREQGLELSDVSSDSGAISYMSSRFWTLRGAALLSMLDS